MFCWYSGNKAEINFDRFPFVAVRYYVPFMTIEEKKSIEKYPFISKIELGVLLKDVRKNKEYTFVVPKSYCYDGASIPRFFWRVAGSNYDNRYLVAALIHDVLCEHHEYVNNDRAFSTDVFNALLQCSGVGNLKRFFMKNSVACYQTLFCNWGK